MSRTHIISRPFPKNEPSSISLPLRRIWQTWWPLAIAWLITTAEIPMMSAVVARLAAPELSLAAWGIAFPITIILSAPLMSILAASASLSKDWDSYVTLRRYLFVIAGILITIHFLLAFTPLYDLFLVPLINIPPEVIAPTQLGFQIMFPYAIGMGFRRFNNGVLIRFGHSKVMLIGAAVRVGINILVLILFSFTDNSSGVLIAASAVIIGVSVEAIYVVWRVGPVLRNQLKEMPSVEAKDKVTFPAFLSFYLPLVIMSLLYTTLQPVISGGLARMPDPVSALAIWPVLRGVQILVTSGALAHTETVVVLLDEPNSARSLQRFTIYLSATLMAIMFMMNITPLAEWWFRQVAFLPPALIPAAKQGLWLLTFTPGLMVIQNQFQARLMNQRRTRGITEAFMLALIAIIGILALGILWQGIPSIIVAMFAILTGDIIRTAWLWYRTRPTTKTLSMKQEELQYA